METLLSQPLLPVMFPGSLFGLSREEGLRVWLPPGFVLLQAAAAHPEMHKKQLPMQSQAVAAHPRGFTASFPTFYLQVNVSIISAGELGIFDFATGNPSREIGPRRHHSRGGWASATAWKPGGGAKTGEKTE